MKLSVKSVGLRHDAGVLPVLQLECIPRFKRLEDASKLAVEAYFLLENGALIEIAVPDADGGEGGK